MKTTLVTVAVLSTAAATKLRAQESAQLSARTNMYMEVDTGLEATMTPQDMRAVKVQVGGCRHPNCPPSVTVDVPAGEFLSCPGQVDKGNWHGHHPGWWWQYGDRFQPTVDGNSVKVTRKDTGNDSHGWGMNLSFDCFVGKSVLVNIGSNHGHNPGPKEASVPHLPAGFELDCPKTVSIQNWLGHDTYGDTFDIQIEDEAVMATRTDANNPQSGWGMNLEFECAVKAVMTAAPNKWMATRTGRSYNVDGKRFAEWGAVAQNADVAGANLQCCSLDGTTATRMVHGEGGPACNRDAAGTQHDGGMTWITAYNACKDGGMRLCTDAEVLSEVGGYTGCGFDDKRLWTSTPWSEVLPAARKGACTSGFDGANCENNIDDCASTPCQHEGTCIDGLLLSDKSRDAGVNDYTCDCAPGFDGDNCENNIDDCASTPCQHEGTCIDGVNEYTCDCAHGFDGDNCENNNWTLIFRSTLVSEDAGTTSHANGDFSTSDPKGSTTGNGEYRTGMTAEEMNVLGVTGIMVKNGDDVKIFDQGRYDAQGFADPGTNCNARGKSLGNDLYWHGGAGGCHGSPHMGLSYKTKGDVHMNCNSGISGGIQSQWERDLAKSSDFTHFGHFHKWHRNTGAYSFGQHCGNDQEGGETFSYWVLLEATTPPSKWMSARFGRSYKRNGKPRSRGFGAAAHNAYKPVANLQCCSNDGSKADRKPFGKCNKDASGKQWDGGMTWSKANDICQAAGQRLCTDTEVLSGIGGRTGCGFDHQYVWTSTPWDQVPEDARKEN